MDWTSATYCNNKSTKKKVRKTDGHRKDYKEANWKSKFEEQVLKIGISW